MSAVGILTVDQILESVDHFGTTGLAANFVLGRTESAHIRLQKEVASYYRWSNCRAMTDLVDLGTSCGPLMTVLEGGQDPAFDVHYPGWLLRFRTDPSKDASIESETQRASLELRSPVVNRVRPFQTDVGQLPKQILSSAVHKARQCSAFVLSC